MKYFQNRNPCDEAKIHLASRMRRGNLIPWSKDGGNWDFMGTFSDDGRNASLEKTLLAEAFRISSHKMKWVSQGEGFVPHFLPLEEKPSSIYSFLKETLLRLNVTKLCQTATKHVCNVSRAETCVMRLHYLASAAQHCINWFSFKAPSMSFPPQQPNNFQEQRIPHNPSPRRWHSKLPSPNNRGKRWGKTSCARTTKSKNWVTLHRTRRRSTNSAFLNT